MKFIDRAKNLVKQQLSQGATSQGIAKTVAVGTVIATIPIIGVTTALCVFVGVRLKLNQPIIQMVNYFLYPVQIALLPVFLKAGSFFSGQDIQVNPITLISLFKEDPMDFLKQYGLAGLYATLVWVAASPIIYLIVYPIVKRLAELFLNSRKKLG